MSEPEQPQTSDAAHVEPAARRRWLLIALVVVVVVGLPWVRAIVESGSELAAGRVAEERGDLREAVRHYRHAVEWHAPLNPNCRTAADALFSLGARDDPAESLWALESLRSAILVTRGLTTPHDDLIPATEAQIAEHRGQEAAERTGEPLTAEIARQLRLLIESRQMAPNPWWSLLTGLGFVGWIGSSIQVARRGFRADGSLNRRPAAIWASLSCLSLLAWILGLFLV